MNIEMCKKCEYYPKFYELGKISDEEFIFYGYQDMKDGTSFVSCIVFCKNNGLNFPAKRIENIIPSTNSFDLLNDKRVYPSKQICPYYMEHLINDWNKKK